MNVQGPKDSGIVFKCLGLLVVGLLLAGIIGGVVVSQQVSAMSTQITALTLSVRDMNARILYIERAIRRSTRHRDDPPED